MAQSFGAGALVIVYLQSPREKIWGELIELSAAGIAVRGIDLRSFDDWLRGLSDPEEQGIRPSRTFFPMSRIEKVLIDEAEQGAPSLDAQCAARTGLGLREHLTRLDALQRSESAVEAER